MKMIELFNALFHLVAGGAKLSHDATGHLSPQEMLLGLCYIGIGACILLTLIEHWRRG